MITSKLFVGIKKANDPYDIIVDVISLKGSFNIEEFFVKGEHHSQFIYVDIISQ